MDVSISTDSLYSATANMVNDQTKAENLQAKLNSKSATDEELLEACKGFETYLLEQVFKGMEKTIPETEDKNPYLEQFGGKLYEEYAKDASENSNIGIAQMLYESMKRNT